MRLTKPDLQGILRSVAACLPPSKERGTADTLLDAYYHALGLLSVEEVTAAADEIIKADRWFPAPARFWTIARERRQHRPASLESLTLAQRSRRWQSQGDWSLDPCPVCGSVLAELPHGRMNVTHDAQRHAQAGIGYAGLP